ncbi:MAG: homocysteine S-methyltransferase family protein [Planctomycetota bacterium]
MSQVLPSSILLLDGATGSELERAGVDIALPLWSARAVLESPGAVQRVHESYLDAGAAAVTTATFRTTRRALAREGLGDRAGELTRRAVALARAAVRCRRPGALVLGSVAPLEECYAPELAPPASVCAEEHEWLMGDLLAAGVDRLLLETMGTVRESAAAARVARALAPGRWMIAFCLRGEGPPGVLLSGEPLLEVLPELEGAMAVGVNCVAAPATLAQVVFLREHVPARTAVMAYANVGYADEAGNWICTDAVDPGRYAALAREWIEAGATIVGGCCGTRPAHVRAMAEVCAQP